ncbi:hypothetical protein NLJ89_g8280 [Agrocybe chaxingu]|uniref:Uncharacterized protein n=1 Tax=Agrocybe chaxingu TaxID=84603 RepID=A0A9W8JVJ4_9AGAR|nr:hypothetical protein NLJ89_g8280 [Agrocybe chaxingu]
MIQIEHCVPTPFFIASSYKAAKALDDRQILNPLCSMDTVNTNSAEHISESGYSNEYHRPPSPHTPTLQRQRSAPPASLGPYQYHHLEAGSRTHQSLLHGATRSSVSLKYEGYTAGNPFRPSSLAHRVSSEITYDDIEATGQPTELLTLGSRFGSSTSVLGMNESTSSIESGQRRGYAADDPFNPSSHANRVAGNLTYDHIPPTTPAIETLDGVGPSVEETRGERSLSPEQRGQRQEDQERLGHETKETDIDWEAQAHRPLRGRPFSTITSSTAPAERRSKNKEFLLDLQYQTTLLVLMRLPMLYFSRVVQIFEEADLSKEQLKYMYCQATETKSDHVYSIHKSPDFDELYPIYKNFKYSWESFVESLLKEWKTFNIISALLLGAILTLFQIPGVANDPLIKFTALLSLLCALISLLHGCIYIIRFGTMRKTYVAVEWALEAQKLRNPLWNTWTVLALPAIWLTWSIVLYLVCIFSYVWRTIPADGEKSPYAWNDHLVLAARILFSSAFGVGIVHGFFVIRTFRRWGSLTEKQWIKRVHHWKQKRSTNPRIQESERARSQSQSTTFFSKAGDVIVDGFEIVTIPTTPPSAPAVAVEPPTPPGRESRFQTFRTRYAARRSPPGATPSPQATQVTPHNVGDNLTLPPSSRRRWASSLKSALKRQSPESAGATETSQFDQRPPLTRRPSQKSVRFSDPRVSQLIQRLPSAQSLEQARLSRTSSRIDQADPEHQSYEAVAEADESTEGTSGIMVSIPENTQEESRVQPEASASIFDDKTQGNSGGEATCIPKQDDQRPMAPVLERTNSTRSESIKIDIVAEEDITEEPREGQRMGTIHEGEEKETQDVVREIPRSSSPDSKI